MHKVCIRSTKTMWGLWAAAIGLVVAAPAFAADVTYDPQDNVKFTYCYAHSPVAHIKPGDSVSTSTRDASNDAFAPTDKTLAPKLDLTKVNPQTGPFYIDGAEPGDTLVVHIDKIDLNRDWGWGGSIPYFGAMAPEYKTAMITPAAPDRLFVWHLDKNRNVAMLDLPNSKIGKVEVPLRPFFGTIGTAPKGKECISSLVPGPHGANMDFNEVVEGVTMYFPVFEPGALFMLGDGHSAQGDGEIDGAAIETPFTVKFTVNLIKGKKINWPRLVNDKYIMSIGSTRPLMDAMRLACADLISWLVDDYGYDKYEALQLLGQTARLIRLQRGRSGVFGGLRAGQEIPPAIARVREDGAGGDLGPNSASGRLSSREAIWLTSFSRFSGEHGSF